MVLASFAGTNFLYTKSFKYSIIIASSKAIMNLWVLDYKNERYYEMKKGAFTLAEVLLTLAIIGVVAAMTVPSLMTSTEDKKLGAAAKKAYNTLQNAITMKQAQTDLTPADVGSGETLFGMLMGKTNDKVQVLKYNEVNSDAAGATVITTPDGIVMQISKTGACGNGYGDDASKAAACYVTVDVNGTEGPTFSAAVAGSTAAGAKVDVLSAKTKPGSLGTFDRKKRDLVLFQVYDMNVVPVTTDAETMRYIKGKK